VGHNRYQSYGKGGKMKIEKKDGKFAKSKKKKKSKAKKSKKKQKAKIKKGRTKKLKERYFIGQGDDKRKGHQEQR
jgi:hypothetical protein